MNQEINKLNSLRWRFDVNTFRLLGRDLITDRITAVFELVKNCYDANATEVFVNFQNVLSKTSDGKIIISDNGLGMSFDDIKNKWMVVGTNSKRTTSYSPPPFNRKFVGEKGIGRFAVDKLGEQVIIRTKQDKDDNWLNVAINWDAYEAKSINSSKESQLSLFTDIDNEYFYEKGDSTDHGTQLIISKISETWTELDIDRLYKELSKLVSPFYPIDPPFNIYIKSNEFQLPNELVKAEAIKFYSHYGEIGFDSLEGFQETLKFNNRTGEIFVSKTSIKSFGPVKMKLYYFNEAAKRRYNAAYKNDDTRIDGIKIYRDGVIATPFAEFEANTERRRDILGIDKRRWRGTFDKIGTREIIGILEITKKDNPNIIDATNRQDFIDNEDYKALKEFIFEQISAFEKLKDYERFEKRTLVERELLSAGKDVKIFERELEKIERNLLDNDPNIKQNLAQLREQARYLHTSISRGIDEQKKFQKDVERKEKILYSIVSMQEYASLVAHAVRTSIAKVKHFGEFFKLRFPDPRFENLFKEYAISIYDEMNTLISVTDFMLSYASADKDYEEFNISDLIRDLLQNAYENIFSNEKINLEIDIRDDFIIDTNKKAFQDIFQNLVSNSLKALRGIENKKIKCSGHLNSDSFVIYFSDNGIGIDKSDREWIFGLYNTRTADLGGSGVGLYIVEKQVKALNGIIEVIDSEFQPNGATFKITIPFNKLL